ncbi:hypothetical protein EVAR_31785_1 [Eumeta japonica]|uniref:Uncharacterized protein n=1 Tax=Eumeta variegata TaxID=151549 RepID=A0A4C1W5S5_EUMVA|nr:hypothetical protein EVAR_31785_1 [Eumeta japonica]
MEKIGAKATRLRKERHAVRPTTADEESDGCSRQTSVWDVIIIIALQTRVCTFSKLKEVPSSGSSLGHSSDRVARRASDNNTFCRKIYP